MGFVEELGEIALVSRMKRLAERMHQDNAAVFKEQQLPFEPRWSLILYLLAEKSPLSIMEIAKELGITHPTVNQLAEEILQKGFISSITDPHDKRRRLLALTESGQALLTGLKPVCQDMTAAAREVIHACGHDVIEVLARMEQVLAEESYYERIQRHIRHRQQTTTVPNEGGSPS